MTASLKSAAYATDSSVADAKRPSGGREGRAGRVIPHYAGPAALLRHSLPARPSQPLNFAELIRGSLRRCSCARRRSGAAFLVAFLTTCLWAGGFVAGSAHAQDAPPRTINGYVEDAESGERLPGATVSVPDLGIGSVTNQYGFYSLTVRLDSLTLAFGYLGYEAVAYTLTLSADTTLDAALAPVAIGLEGIEVVAQADSLIDQPQMGRHEVAVDQIQSLPALLGEVDIQKTLQLLPGVQSGSEGRSGFYVRGGGPDQNLILLDGLPLYNPSHLFGFLGVFNADAMKHVELIKGGFPARYGGRLSSVVNLTMKEGNLKGYSGDVGTGLVASRVTLEGPIVRDKASFLFTARRTFADLLARPFLPDDTRGGYYFYDLNFKANYIVSRKDRIYLSGYSGRDLFYITDEWDGSESDGDIGWRNRLAALRWNRLFGNRTFSNLLIGLTNYSFAVGVDERDSYGGEGSAEYESNISYVSDILDYTVKADLEHRPSPSHYLRFGAEGIAHRFSPGMLWFNEQEGGETLEDTTLVSPVGVVHSREAALYVEDDMTLWSGFRVNAGLRMAWYFVDGKNYPSLEPRLSMSRRVARRTSAKLSYVRMQQPVHFLTASTGNPFTDFWVSAMDRMPPQKSHQAAVGLVRNIREGRYEASLESYYKWMSGLIEYKAGTQTFDSVFRDWPELIETGRGAAYGVELFLQKKTGRTSGWIGYSWAQATRDFKNLNNGEIFPYRYDRRHDLSVVTQYRLTQNKEISVAWVYGSGYPAWLPVGRHAVELHDEYTQRHAFWAYQAPDRVGVDYGPRNASRLRSYHRLDLAVHFRKERSWGTRTLTLGTYNTYNRRNPFVVYPVRQSGDRSTFRFRQLSLFPVLPALSYRISF